MGDFAWKSSANDGIKKASGPKALARSLTPDHSDTVEERRTMALKPIYARIGFLQAEHIANGARLIGGAT